MVFLLTFMYNLFMEIILVNESEDKNVYRYKKDYMWILSKTCEVLDRKNDYSLSVIFVEPDRIHEINRDYRQIDRPTDVISFALQDDDSNLFTEEDQNELGDIFINVRAMRSQAQEYGHSIRREACFLFCHGLLHLMGYDHMTKEDEEVMFHLQDVILDELVKR